MDRKEQKMSFTRCIVMKSRNRFSRVFFLIMLVGITSFLLTGCSGSILNAGKWDAHVSTDVSDQVLDKALLVS